MTGKQLRSYPGESVANKLPKNPLYLIASDLYDTFNLGCLFRLADAVSANRLIITGNSEIPPNKKIRNASCGTYKVVNWTYIDTTINAVSSLREELPGVDVVAVELADNSIKYNEKIYKTPTALIIGNESYGLNKEVLQVVDSIVEIPMYGINASLNVINAASIVAYQVVSQFV